jgi:hypothetical protein
MALTWQAAPRPQLGQRPEAEGLTHAAGLCPRSRPVCDYLNIIKYN